MALLVARGAPPEEVFAAVTAEIRRLLDADLTTMARYDPDGAITYVAQWRADGEDHVSGTRAHLGGDVSPCSFLGPGHVAGSLRDRMLGEIWHRSAGFTGIRALPGGNPAGGAHFAGGCRARSLVLAGSINAPDPWLGTPGDRAGHRQPLPLLTVELEGRR